MAMVRKQLDLSTIGNTLSLGDVDPVIDGAFIVQIKNKGTAALIFEVCNRPEKAAADYYPVSIQPVSGGGAITTGIPTGDGLYRVSSGGCLDCRIRVTTALASTLLDVDYTAITQGT